MEINSMENRIIYKLCKIWFIWVRIFSFAEYKISADDEKLGALIMEALTTLLAGNVQNANVFRECGGARCAHNLVPYIDCRYQVLGIVRELILTAGGDDDMATLLGVMHSAPPSALVLKTHILKVNIFLRRIFPNSFDNFFLNLLSFKINKIIILYALKIKNYTY